MSNIIHECVLCGKVGRTVRVDGKRYCDKHYKRWQSTGKFTIDPTSHIYETDGFAVIRTRKGDEFKIDSCDVEKCKKLNWCTTAKGYGQAHIDGKYIKLHRYLMFGSAHSDMLIDHINGDIKDNRRENLRICTHKENSLNRKKQHKSLARGVRKRDNRYIAEIKCDGKKIHIGSFKTLEEAVSARRREEIRLFGDFSPAISRNETGGGFELYEEE